MVRARVTLLVVVALAAGVLALVVVLARSSRVGSPAAAASGPSTPANPALDAGTVLSVRAPNFTLTDQFGQRVSLRSFRGHAVIVAFNDSECTTVCPMTTTAMVDAKALLGRAGSGVRLLGVNANPKATSVRDVLAYSRAHGLLHQWRFLTAPEPQLERVWKAYGIAVQILGGQLDHTPAVFLIDGRGRQTRLYDFSALTYSSIPQQARLLASGVAALLPGHVRVGATRYAAPATTGPSASITLPGAGGGTVRLGRGEARLQLFFATWDSEVMALGRQLDALNSYQAAATGSHLPPLVGVDEGSVEPSPSALPGLLAGLPRPLSYPVAIDASGRVADGYEVQDQPWFVLTSKTGRILWFYDVSTQGALSAAQLTADVRAALSAPPKAPTQSAAAVTAALAGSPPPLASLHAQADRLLGSQPALTARLRALRGYPVVLNVWQSLCVPCRKEFSLLASAAARYGRRVAFLGADASDVGSDAAAFLARHPVSYPSYQTTIEALSSLAPIQGLPTTIFIDPAGKVVQIHSGQYETQGSLDQDIATYSRPA